ncbi:hypothetical protein MKK67_09890 [Methylobacterium sp. J-072]|uniref:hypothetical protein n=1 Tax=Methylobacterium sp. J-072 TaxID=2836651 RepID=UPI001FBA1E6A|nr:hypothetical protein [Methylobacterium sp. J-072]MCJ2092810.1 hypothetical protein [Methylobacterium sp. J-072]
MSFRTSLKSFINRDAVTPSLRERAASLRASVSTGIATSRPLPAPGSEEAKEAFKAACHEHSLRTNPPGGWPDLMRDGDRIWTRHDLGRAMDAGDITPAKYARLYPLASERELQIETVGHELNLGALFALAYADEYPVRDAASDDTAGGDAELLGLRGSWEAAVEAFAQAIRNQVAVSDKAEAVEPCPSRDRPHTEWLSLVAGWRERTGVENVEAASAEALDDLCEVEDRIAAMPATTLAGLKLKARIAERHEVDWPADLADGLVRDILAIGEPEVEVDADLIRLGRQFEAARAREIAACDACNVAQREADRHMPERPACLTLSAADHPLGVYRMWTYADALEGVQLAGADIAWLRRKMPMTRDILRPVRLGERESPDHPGRRHDIAPYPEAQVRAEEIVTAWDAWRTEQGRIQDKYVTPELEDAAVTAGEGAATIAEQIARLPTRTAVGFQVKLRALSHYRREALLSELPEDPDPDQILSHSLWRDVQGEMSPIAEAVDWRNPPAGFMASPAIEPFSFARIPDAIGLELDRLHGIAVAEFKRRGGPEKSEAEQSALRRELHLDELNYVPPRENGEVSEPALDTLSAQILTLWPAWAAHTGDDGTDEQTAAYEAMQQRRFALLHAADALPATPNSIQPKALALAWLHYVNEWRQGQKRDKYSTDGGLAIDIHIAALAQGELQGHVVPHLELNLVDQIDFASVSLDDLQALHDIADLVGGVAYATAWTGRCKARGAGDHYNAAGELMQRLGDALTDVESAAIREARLRRPTTRDDRETRLKILALPVIQNGDHDDTAAFARELAAHAEAERAGR